MKRLEKRKTFVGWVATIAVSVLLITACTPSTSPQGQPEGTGVSLPQEVQRVTLEESKDAFDNNSAIFLDVRSEAAYETSHIPGALSIPLQFLEPRLGELDPDQWIITYCT